MSLHISIPINQHRSTSVLLYTLPTDFLFIVYPFLGPSFLSRPSLPQLSFLSNRAISPDRASSPTVLPLTPFFFFPTVIPLPTIVPPLPIIFSLSTMFFHLKTLAILIFILFGSISPMLTAHSFHRLKTIEAFTGGVEIFRNPRRLPKRAK